MKIYRGRGLGDFYMELIRELTEHGREVKVRGKVCLEMKEQVAFVYDNPGHFLMAIPERGYNIFFAIAEVIWILAGDGRVEWIAHFNKKMRDFADNEDDLHGAYGKRIFHHGSDVDYDGINQAEAVIHKLEKDPFTRQAVICIWDVERDNYTLTKDIPCNNLIYYTLRDGYLDQTVVIRSNDLIWGVPYNAVQFSGLHAYIAGRLHAKMGRFTYVINNLHYYLTEYKQTLSNLINRAYDRTVKTEAMEVEGFGPIPDKYLPYLIEDVQRAIDSHGESIFADDSIHFSRVGFWKRTVPLVIGIFAWLKNQSSPEMVRSNTSFSNMVSLAETLPDSIVWLMIDQFRNSEKLAQQAFAEALLEGRK